MQSSAYIFFLGPHSAQSFITDTVEGHADDGMHSEKVGCINKHTIHLEPTPLEKGDMLWIFYFALERFRIVGCLVFYVIVIVHKLIEYAEL